MEVSMGRAEIEETERLKYLMTRVIEILKQYGITDTDTALGAAYLVLKELQDAGVKL
jgi:hypothetical protein